MLRNILNHKLNPLHVLCRCLWFLEFYDRFYSYFTGQRRWRNSKELVKEMCKLKKKLMEVCNDKEDD